MIKLSLIGIFDFVETPMHFFSLNSLTAEIGWVIRGFNREQGLAEIGRVKQFVL